MKQKYETRFRYQSERSKYKIRIYIGEMEHRNSSVVFSLCQFKQSKIHLKNVTC